MVRAVGQHEAATTFEDASSFELTQIRTLTPWSIAIHERYTNLPTLSTGEGGLDGTDPATNREAISGEVELK